MLRKGGQGEREKRDRGPEHHGAILRLIGISLLMATSGGRKAGAGPSTPIAALRSLRMTAGKIGLSIPPFAGKKAKDGATMLWAGPQRIKPDFQEIFRKDCEDELYEAAWVRASSNVEKRMCWPLISERSSCQSSLGIFKKTSTTAGSNCVPEQRRISSRALSKPRALR